MYDRSGTYQAAGQVLPHLVPSPHNSHQAVSSPPYLRYPHPPQFAAPPQRPPPLRVESPKHSGRTRHHQGGSSSRRSAQLSTPDIIRNKLEKILVDKAQFIKSAQASFYQFDVDKSGTLSFTETQALIQRLCDNLKLPPVDKDTLQQIFDKYDQDDSGELTLDEFAQMYWRLLLRVREKYYPSKKFRVRRNVFVGRFPLCDPGSIHSLFEFQKKIGAGTFGEVHLVKDLRSGLVRVCKTINKDQAAIPAEQIEAEITVLKQLDHPNIIKIYDVYEDYNNVYIIMEPCEGGELLGRILQAQQRGKTLTEKYVMSLMRQILLALAYFHSQKVVHKDLKPENVLFLDNTPSSPIKVIDFGLAEIFKRNDEYSENAAGTVLYMAPEVFKRRLHLKCDIWSAGCIMYLLLTGHFPFSGQRVTEVRQKVLNDQPPFETHCRHVSTVGVELLRLMLQKSPKRRPSAAQCLQHQWFKPELTSHVVLPIHICDNLKRYMKQANLKNVLINLMAHQLDFNGSQIKQINKIFTNLDRDQNGMLSSDELAHGLRVAGLQPWEVTKIIQALDIAGTGSISYTEFLAACYTWRESELNIVWTAFNKLDTDHDGVISVEEFTKLLLSGDDEVNQSKLMRPRANQSSEAIEQEIRELVRQVDRNGDGRIDWDEFLDYMRGTNQ